jgi:hypothetical protein
MAYDPSTSPHDQCRRLSAAQNYNLIVPNVRSFLLHIGASPTQAGIIIGCCDLASMPSTVGAQPLQLRV